MKTDREKNGVRDKRGKGQDAEARRVSLTSRNLQVAPLRRVKSHLIDGLEVDAFLLTVKGSKSANDERAASIKPSPNSP